ncbi:unnamed protein product [Lampetra planeri]
MPGNGRQREREGETERESNFAAVPQATVGHGRLRLEHSSNAAMAANPTRHRNAPGPQRGTIRDRRGNDYESRSA